VLLVVLAPKEEDGVLAGTGGATEGGGRAALAAAVDLSPESLPYTCNQFWLGSGCVPPSHLLALTLVLVMHAERIC